MGAAKYRCKRLEGLKIFAKTVRIAKSSVMMEVARKNVLPCRAQEGKWVNLRNATEGGSPKAPSPCWAALQFVCGD